MGQGFRGVKVLPASLADLKGTQISLPGQLPHAIGKRTVPVPGCRFEFVKQHWAAEEHSGIECVIVRDLLANLHNTIAIAPTPRPCPSRPLYPPQPRSQPAD